MIKNLQRLKNKTINLEISFLEFLKECWKRKVICAIGVACFIGAGFLFGKYTEKKMYEGYVDIIVVPKDGTGSQNPIQYLQIADLALIDLQNLLVSDAFSQKIMEKNNISLENIKLSNVLKMTNKTSSRLFQVVITHNDKATVHAIKETLVDYAKSEIETIAAIKEVRVLYQSEVTQQTMNNSKKYSIYGGMLGSIIAVISILVVTLVNKIKFENTNEDEE